MFMYNISSAQLMIGLFLFCRGDHLVFLMLLCFFKDGDSFSKSEKEWRAERVESMKSDSSWLTVIGLYWLVEGENGFGTRKDQQVVLPVHSTVERAGVFTLRDGKVHFKMARAQRALLEDKPLMEGELLLGQVLTHNHLRMFLLERGGKLALRVRDLRSPGFLEFEALSFFKPKDKYVVDAQFEAYDEPQTLSISTIINTEIELLVPGKLKFTLKGKEMELFPTLGTLEDEQFFIMFKDETSAVSTYGGGRFLYMPKPIDGKVTLNFNRAINPPCAYTNYATCPIPPERNWLNLSIEAGERVYKDH